MNPPQDTETISNLSIPFGVEEMWLETDNWQLHRQVQLKLNDHILQDFL